MYILRLYGKNLTSRELDFDDSSDENPDFIRYAVDFRYRDPVVNTKQNPQLPLENLTDAATILLSTKIQPNNDQWKAQKKRLHTARNLKEWSYTTQEYCIHDLRLNSHLGAERLMTPIQIQDRS